MALGIMFFLTLEKHNTLIAGIKHIPNILLSTIDGKDFYLAELQSKRKTAILFFSPECEFCKKEIEGIIERNGECQNVQWVFITIAQPEELEPFLKEYPIESIPNAFLLREVFPEMHIKFDVTAPPSLFIYDEHGKLIKEHRGATSIKTIVEELK